MRYVIFSCSMRKICDHSLEARMDISLFYLIFVSTYFLNFTGCCWYSGLFTRTLGCSTKGVLVRTFMLQIVCNYDVSIHFTMYNFHDVRNAQ